MEERFHIVLIVASSRIIREAVLLKLPPFAKLTDRSRLALAKITPSPLK